MGRRKMLSKRHRSEVRSTGSTRRARGSRFRRNRSPYGVSAVTNVFVGRARGVPDIIGGIFVNPASQPAYITTPHLPPWQLGFPLNILQPPPSIFALSFAQIPPTQPKP